MNQKGKVMVSAEHLYKKFSRDLKSSLYYGMLDVLNSMFNRPLPELHLRQHEFWAVHDLNLQIHEGEILAVVGANGSGKTTLMRMIAGIYPLDQGSVVFNGIKNVTPIFALNAGMQPLFTGRENILIKGAMLGMSEQQLLDKMDFIIEYSELGEFLDTPFGNYSSGMKARLAYSIAIATEPDLFIIDEALAVGDSFFKAKCYDHLKEYVKQPGKAVIFVSNQIKKVLEVATRVVILDGGKLIYDSENIYEALTFYINNSLGHMDEKTRQFRLDKIRSYEI